MAAAFTLSTPAALLPRHSAAGPSLSFRLESRRLSRRGQCAATRRDDGCPRRLPAAAVEATCGRTRRATAVAAAQGQAEAENGTEGSLRMVLLSTAVAVCGSFEFGTCVGYSAPAQAGIVSDIGLSNSQVG